jgi:hypothetical protein
VGRDYEEVDAITRALNECFLPSEKAGDLLVQLTDFALCVIHRHHVNRLLPIWLATLFNAYLEENNVSSIDYYHPGSSQRYERQITLAKFVASFRLRIDTLEVQEKSNAGPQNHPQNSSRRLSINAARSAMGKYYMYEDEASESGWNAGPGSNWGDGRFRGYSKTTSENQVLKELLDKMTHTMALKTYEDGYIYAFRRLGTCGFLKIGSAKDPAKRLSRWEANCGYNIELVFKMYIPQAAGRIERLIHKTLQTHRQIEYCESCSTKGRVKDVHNEWFKVTEVLAWRVVNYWRMFSCQEPYDRFGRLNDYWSSVVAYEKKRSSVMNNVVRWLGDMPGDVVRGMLKPEARRNIRSFHLTDDGKAAWVCVELF